ncbi:hypothetical protein DAPPUDRAFT_255289 [Daphnia pulex]|uniref:Uncharacterized protein n=1 Tax=Daphnia pulex TaxID=6669 RepID=E9H8X4_DAPPU|nr:hypothetical protein DAPPUDRAFT_255289 [Daphnia pulex]|eukprot:EFX71821.1 hypothetical protein DAPPUDRAFT_255289 [Daphnia pulex]
MFKRLSRSLLVDLSFSAMPVKDIDVVEGEGDENVIHSPSDSDVDEEVNYIEGLDQERKSPLLICSVCYGVFAEIAAFQVHNRSCSSTSRVTSYVT